MEDLYCRRDFYTEDNYLCDDLNASPKLCRENISFICRETIFDQNNLLKQ
jgi:hypothetical protein